MERTIKFRGLRTDGKGWVYGGFVKGRSGKSYIFQGNDQGDFIETDDCCEVIPPTVGQFTGLLDKNGVEIYEGDLDSDGRLIKWNNDMTLFCWSYYNDFRNDYFPSSYPTYANESQKWLIIGNIHEQ